MVVYLLFFFFFFKQKTAYEMRISDWSSDVCSSDLERWWSISGQPVGNAFGHFQGFRGSGTDLTEKKRSEREINQLARYDTLTGLANRLQIGRASCRERVCQYV